jgi:uncharacterized protein
VATHRSVIDREALGLGLRPAFYPELAINDVGVGFFEIIVENYLGNANLPRENLRRIAKRYPIVGHGISLDLLGAAPLDLEYLRKVKDLVAEFQMPYMTDHLCWTRHGGVSHHDLLPAPHTRDLVGYAAERAAFVQEYLGVPFGIENLSSYVSFERDEMPEWDFYRAVVEQACCSYMLDINNIYVSSVNHGFNAHDYLGSVLWERVLQVHLAGHQTRPDGMLHDTHDQPVRAEVWQLYREAWRRGGPFPTLLEWDDNVPPLHSAVTELSAATSWRSSESR